MCLIVDRFKTFAAEYRCLLGFFSTHVSDTVMIYKFLTMYLQLDDIHSTLCNLTKESTINTLFCISRKTKKKFNVSKASVLFGEIGCVKVRNFSQDFLIIGAKKKKQQTLGSIEPIASALKLA